MKRCSNCGAPWQWRCDYCGVDSRPMLSDGTRVVPPQGGSVLRPAPTSIPPSGRQIRLNAQAERIRFFDGARAGAASEPKWLKLFPMGVTKHRGDFPKGGIAFTREFFETMLRNWEKAGRPALHVNYDHSSGPAAGWIEDLELREDGPYGLFRWTDKARTHILADEYRFLSPEFVVDAMDKATGRRQGPTLFGCALLNNPFLEELPRVAASNNPNAAFAAGAKTMNPKLIALLALAATATEDDVVKAAEAMKAKAEADALKVTELSAQLEEAQKLKLSADSTKVELSNLRTANETLSAQVKLANEKLTNMEKAQKEAAIDAYLDERVKKGVITPAMREGVKAHALAMGLDEVKKLWDSAPARVQLGEAGIPGSGNPDNKLELRNKVTELAKTLSKESGLGMGEARIRVLENNPELAKQLSA